MNIENRWNFLIKKYIQNECSEEEISELIEIIKNNDDFELPEIQELLKSNKDPKTLSSFEKRILFKSISKKAKVKSKFRFKRSYMYYAAAVFIGILFLTVFYQKFNPNNNKSWSSSNQYVTLKNSSEEKVLKDSDSIDLTNKEGKVIGKQIGNSIVYYSTIKSNEVRTNTLKVPYGKKFQLELSDGTQIHLNSGTTITYPETFPEDGERKISLIGEAYFDVTHDKKHPFIVKAKALNVKVLGTSFNVSAYPEDKTEDVVLVRGSVGMYAEEQGLLEKENILSPGYKGIFEKKNGNISKKEVNIEIYTAWREGRIIFRNMTLANIFKKLERQFGYEIEIENKTLANKKFNTNLGKQSLKEILDSFKKIYGINYTIEEKHITIN